MSPNDQAFPLNMRNDDGTHYFSCAGLTKREYLAVLADGPDDDADAEYVAASLGISCPATSTSTREWLLWWRKARALWKVAEADALIAALNEPQP